MYELTNLLTTIAGCSATIIAIIGGFIASKLIALSTEHNEILSRLREVEEEFSFKLCRGETSSAEWLKIEKKQLLTRKNALEKPKGMKSGLIIFGLFSLFGIIAPLIAIPFTTESYSDYLIVKYCSITIFVIGLLAVFIYLISLLKCKEKDDI